MRTVKEILQNKTLLITGTTGFLGKYFLYTILKNVPDVKKIYLLIRANDDDQAFERFKYEIKNSELFSTIKIKEDQIEVIAGNISQHKLGMALHHWFKISSETDLIINNAASVDFFEPIEDALENNLYSVKYMMEFLNHSPKAKLLHVSTCYVSGKNQGAIKEEFYRPKTKIKYDKNENLDIDQLINQLQTISKSLPRKGHDERHYQLSLKKLGKKISNQYGWNDVYTFTKWIGEQFLKQNRKDKKCVIVRPSIIASSYSGEFPGWLEGFKVIDPLIYYTGTGDVKQFTGKKNCVLDIIPVDIVSNSMLAVLAELEEEKTDELKIYQISTSDKNPIRLKELYQYTKKSFKIPDQKFPFFINYHLYISTLRTTIALLNLTDILTESKKISKSLSMLRKLLYMTRLFGGYTNLDCRFKNDNIKNLSRKLSAEDQVKLNLEQQIDWEKYIIDIHIPGLLKYVIKK